MTDEIERVLREMKAGGRSVKDMSAAIGKSMRTTTRYLQTLGLTTAADRVDILDDDVIQAWNSGLTIVEIANKFSCSHDTITKRLSKYGITCDRASGIKRHFERTHGELWSSIESDLDAGASVSALSVKYHMRYQSIFRLMDSHAYVYKRRHSFAISEWDMRVQAATDHTTGHTARWDVVELEYLNGILEYFDTYGSLPTARLLASFLGKPVGSVTSVLRTHQLDVFIDDTTNCSAVVRLTDALQSLGVRYEVNNRTLLRDSDGRVLEIDLYLPDFKLGLEVNPTGTHSVDVGKMGVSDVGYHQRKSLAAMSAGIGLVHLYDEDIYDSRRYNILIGRLRALVCPGVRVGARSCVLKSLTVSDAGCFLDAYHFQGRESSAGFRFGLYFADELVAVLCVGRSRYTNHDFEIIRYCTHPGYVVMGGFGKLLRAFARSEGVSGKIVSYMDLNKRFIVSNVYEKNGFVFDGLTAPDYFWAKKYGIPVLRRYETTKAKLVAQGFDANKTEVDIMRERGYFRVFGAGSARYVYDL